MVQVNKIWACLERYYSQLSLLHTTLKLITANNKMFKDKF